MASAPSSQRSDASGGAEEGAFLFWEPPAGVGGRAVPEDLGWGFSEVYAACASGGADGGASRKLLQQSHALVAALGKCLGYFRPCVVGQGERERFLGGSDPVSPWGAPESVRAALVEPDNRRLMMTLSVRLDLAPHQALLLARKILLSAELDTSQALFSQWMQADGRRAAGAAAQGQGQGGVGAVQGLDMLSELLALCRANAGVFGDLEGVARRQLRAERRNMLRLLGLLISREPGGPLEPIVAGLLSEGLEAQLLKDLRASLEASARRWEVPMGARERAQLEQEDVMSGMEQCQLLEVLLAAEQARGRGSSALPGRQGSLERLVQALDLFALYVFEPAGGDRRAMSASAERIHSVKEQLCSTYCIELLSLPELRRAWMVSEFGESVAGEGEAAGGGAGAEEDRAHPLNIPGTSGEAGEGAWKDLERLLQDQRLMKCPGAGPIYLAFTGFIRLARAAWKSPILGGMDDIHFQAISAYLNALETLYNMVHRDSFLGARTQSELEAWVMLTGASTCQRDLHPPFSAPCEVLLRQRKSLAYEVVSCIALTFEIEPTRSKSTFEMMVLVASEAVAGDAGLCKAAWNEGTLKSGGTVHTLLDACSAYFPYDPRPLVRLLSAMSGHKDLFCDGVLGQHRDSGSGLYGTRSASLMYRGSSTLAGLMGRSETAVDERGFGMPPPGGDQAERRHCAEKAFEYLKNLPYFSCETELSPTFVIQLADGNVELKTQMRVIQGRDGLSLGPLLKDYGGRGAQASGTVLPAGTFGHIVDRRRRDDHADGGGAGSRGGGAEGGGAMVSASSSRGGGNAAVVRWKLGGTGRFPGHRILLERLAQRVGNLGVLNTNLLDDTGSLGELLASMELLESLLLGSSACDPLLYNSPVAAFSAGSPSHVGRDLLAVAPLAPDLLEGHADILTVIRILLMHLCHSADRYAYDRAREKMSTIRAGIASCLRCLAGFAAVAPRRVLQELEECGDFPNEDVGVASSAGRADAPLGQAAVRSGLRQSFGTEYDGPNDPYLLRLLAGNIFGDERADGIFDCSFALVHLTSSLYSRVLLSGSGAVADGGAEAILKPYVLDAISRVFLFSTSPDYRQAGHLVQRWDMAVLSLGVARRAMENVLLDFAIPSKEEVAWVRHPHVSISKAVVTLCLHDERICRSLVASCTSLRGGPVAMYVGRKLLEEANPMLFHEPLSVHQIFSAYSAAEEGLLTVLSLLKYLAHSRITSRARSTGVEGGAGVSAAVETPVFLECLHAMDHAAGDSSPLSSFAVCSSYAAMACVEHGRSSTARSAPYERARPMTHVLSLLAVEVVAASCVVTGMDTLGGSAPLYSGGGAAGHPGAEGVHRALHLQLVDPVPMAINVWEDGRSWSQHLRTALLGPLCIPRGADAEDSSGSPGFMSSLRLVATAVGWQPGLASWLLDKRAGSGTKGASQHSPVAIGIMALVHLCAENEDLLTRRTPQVAGLLSLLEIIWISTPVYDEFLAPLRGEDGVSEGTGATAAALSGPSTSFWTDAAELIRASARAGARSGPYLVPESDRIDESLELVDIGATPLAASSSTSISGGARAVARQSLYLCENDLASATAQAQYLSIEASLLQISCTELFLAQKLADEKQGRGPLEILRSVLDLGSGDVNLGGGDNYLQQLQWYAERYLGQKYEAADMEALEKRSRFTALRCVLQAAADRTLARPLGPTGSSGAPFLPIRLATCAHYVGQEICASVPARRVIARVEEALRRQAGGADASMQLPGWARSDFSEAEVITLSLLHAQLGEETGVAVDLPGDLGVGCIALLDSDVLLNLVSWCSVMHVEDVILKLAPPGPSEETYGPRWGCGVEWTYSRAALAVARPTVLEMSQLTLLNGRLAVATAAHKAMQGLRSLLSLMVFPSTVQGGLGGGISSGGAFPSLQMGLPAILTLMHDMSRQLVSMLESHRVGEEVRDNTHVSPIIVDVSALLLIFIQRFSFGSSGGEGGYLASAEALSVVSKTARHYFLALNSCFVFGGDGKRYVPASWQPLVQQLLTGLTLILQRLNDIVGSGKQGADAPQAGEAAHSALVDAQGVAASMFPYLCDVLHTASEPEQQARAARSDRPAREPVSKVPRLGQGVGGSGAGGPRPKGAEAVEFDHSALACLSTCMALMGPAQWYPLVLKHLDVKDLLKRMADTVQASEGEASSTSGPIPTVDQLAGVSVYLRFLLTFAIEHAPMAELMSAQGCVPAVAAVAQQTMRAREAAGHILQQRINAVHGDLPMNQGGAMGVAGPGLSSLQGGGVAAAAAATATAAEDMLLPSPVASNQEAKDMLGVASEAWGTVLKLLAVLVHSLGSHSQDFVSSAVLRHFLGPYGHHCLNTVGHAFSMAPDASKVVRMGRFNSYVTWCMRYLGEVEAASFLWCQMVSRSSGSAERWLAELPVDFHYAVHLATTRLVKCWDVARGAYAAYADASAPEGAPSAGSVVDKKNAGGHGQQGMTVHGLFLRSGSLRLPTGSGGLVGRDASSSPFATSGARGRLPDASESSIQQQQQNQRHHAVGDELWYSPEHVDDDDGFNAWPRRVVVTNYRLSKGSTGYEYDILLDSLELKAGAGELRPERQASQNYNDEHLKAMAGAAQSALALFRNLVVFMCRAQAVLRDRPRTSSISQKGGAAEAPKDLSGFVPAKELLSDTRGGEASSVLSQIQFILERAGAMDAGTLLASHGPADHEWTMQTMALLHQVVEVVEVEGGIAPPGGGARIRGLIPAA